MEDKSKKTEVAVLMSTYNGEHFLKEQLDSILSQESVSTFLFIRDDGSTDHTVDIIRQYQNKGKNIYLKVGENIGPANSFLSLIYQNRNFEYYSLADQDDIWKQDKLVSAIRLLEKQTNTPALYYSALTLVDSNGNLIKKAIPEKINKKTALLNFQATGCTIVYNDLLLKELLKYKPKGIYMHDAWLAVIASFFGTCVRDETSHIMYRQHENNAVGMKHRNIISRAVKFITTRKNWHYNIAANFYEGYKAYLNAEDTDRVKRILKYKKSFIDMIKLIGSDEVQELPNSERNSVIRLVLFRNL